MNQPAVAVNVPICQNGLSGFDSWSPLNRVADLDRYPERICHASTVWENQYLAFTMLLTFGIQISHGCRSTRA